MPLTLEERFDLAMNKADGKFHEVPFEDEEEMEEFLDGNQDEIESNS